MESWDEDELHLVVGIDFGTTYSGVAWTLSNENNKVGIIAGWESELENNERSCKVPTKISYSNAGEVTSWGFQAHDEGDKQLSRFKLLLCEEAKTQAGVRRSFINQLEQDLKVLNLSPREVMSDYLRQLWAHTRATIKLSFKQDFIDGLPIKLVMTIPAMWDHSAQELTRMAAENSGIAARGKLKVELVSEPEAAARYVFSENPSFSLGDAFVVCDAGGGTIDLVSYKVETLNPLRLAMCTEATGDLFGAVYLDDAFKRIVCNKIGENAFKKLSPWSMGKLLNDWENGAKRNFRHGTSAEKAWFVSIPGYMPSLKRKRPEDDSPPAFDGCEKGRIKLKTSELELTFRDVCPRIVGLIQEQISALKTKSDLDAKTIILVGGFGENKYLHEELQKSFPSFEVLKPVNAWSAIARGAVLKGVSDEMVVNHVAKYHYGTGFKTEYDATKHIKDDKEWDKVECCFKATNQMQWYIRRGENIWKDQQIQHTWSRTYTERNQLHDVKKTIYFCPSVQAPERKTSEVLKLCDITTHFDPEIFDELQEYTNPVGVKYRALEFDVMMKVTSSGLQWTVLRNGEEMGRAAVNVVYT